MKMSPYSTITIIYNPNSTGPSKKLAEQARDELHAALPDQQIHLVPTQHAGHAEQLAFEIALASKRPLIISSSGDGGYHEVINGIMQAQAKGATPTTGLLPGGNANDHYHSLHTDALVENIRSGTEQIIDVLKLSSGETERYAHSYIGLGLTASVGRKLTQANLNRVNEAWIVLSSLLNFHATSIEVQRKTIVFHSLLFTNIGRMAKVFTVASDTRVDDGVFEIHLLPKQRRAKFLFSLIKASTKGLYDVSQSKNFSMKTLRNTPVQLDGEVMTIQKGARIDISMEHQVLRCII